MNLKNTRVFHAPYPLSNYAGRYPTFSLCSSCIRLEHNQPLLLPACPPVVPAGRFHGTIYGACFGLLAFCRFFVSLRLGSGGGMVLSLLRFPGQGKQKYEFIPFFSCCHPPPPPSATLCFFCTGKFLEHNVIYSWE